MCLNTGTPKNITFSFQTNGKLMALGVPILKHFRVDIRAVSSEDHSCDFVHAQISLCTCIDIIS